MIRRVLCCLSLSVLSVVVDVPSAAAAPSYRNCTELQKTYAHGIGRSDARDKTTGVPVTTFKRDTAGYKRAMSANAGLDRDRDGIACEKR